MQEERVRECGQKSTKTVTRINKNCINVQLGLFKVGLLIYELSREVNSTHSKLATICQ